MTKPKSTGQDEFAYLPTDELYPSPWNPRKEFSAEELESLKESIKDQGIHTPLLVRRNPNENGGVYEIGAGARRQLAAATLGMEVVPCRVREMTDPEFMNLLQTENPLHAPLSAIDEAQGFRDWMERTGYSAAMMAGKLGRHASYVSRRLKLTELTLDAINALRNGDIDAGHALEIARLIPKDQTAALEMIADRQEYGQATTVVHLREWIEREIHLELANAPFDTGDAALLPAAGSCKECPKRSGFNPDLFPDLRKGDVCTDRDCFKGKVDVLVQLRKRELKESGKDFVQITEGYRGGKNLLTKEQYIDAGG